MLAIQSGNFTIPDNSRYVKNHVADKLPIFLAI